MLVFVGIAPVAPGIAPMSLGIAPMMATIAPLSWELHISLVSFVMRLGFEQLYAGIAQLT